MAQAGNDPTDQIPNLDAAIASLVEALYDPAKLKRVERAMANALGYGETVASALKTATIDSGLEWAGEKFEYLEERAGHLFAPFLAALVGHMLGVEVPTSALREQTNRSGESEIGRKVAATIFETLKAPEGELKPGREGATRLLGALGHLALAAWSEGVILEWAANFVPLLEAMDSIGELGRDLVSATGIDEMGRVALRPLANITVATPLTWEANKTYRPELLTPAAVLRELLAGRWTADQAREELARQGYSDERQKALLWGQYKWLSFDEGFTAAGEGIWEFSELIENLKAQGYDDTTARTLEAVADAKRHRARMDDALGALRSAYVDRRIDEHYLLTFLPAILRRQADQDDWMIATQTIRGLNTRRMSPGQVEACVKAEILPVAAYRENLRLEGYDEEAVLALELLLLKEIRRDQKLEELRAQALAERAAEKKAREEAAAARKAEIERERALARRGPVSDLTRAVVRGLIPIARLVEVLQEQYDPDTVNIFVAAAEEDRQQYLDAQQRAADARKRAMVRNVDVGALEQAVLENTLDLGRFHQRLSQLGFSDDDAQLLTDTLKQRKQDLDDAKRKRTQAEADAKKKSIDLGRFESLVRRGVRTMADYAALLTSLGYDEPARAAMIELLQLQIADDKKAADARAAADAKLRSKGLSLEQERRSVVLGVHTPDDYARFLQEQGFTADAQIALMADLRATLDDAEAARRRRQRAEEATVGAALPLSRIANAARLGLITPDAYQQRLTDAGYSDDDIAIEMELLLQEIADVQAARRRRDELEAKAALRGASLAQVEHAVKVGTATLDDYRAKAAALFADQADVTVVVGTLEHELGALNDARARRVQIAQELAGRGIALDALDAVVLAGAATLDEYVQQLEELGYGPDDAQLLAAQLAPKLAA